MTGRSWPPAARHSLMGSTPFAAVVHSASDIWRSRLLKTTCPLMTQKMCEKHCRNSLLYGNPFLCIFGYVDWLHARLVGF